MAADGRTAQSGLNALLNSQSIAVVGASDRLGTPGSRVMHVLRESKYAGEVIAINPRLPTFAGAATYRSLEDCRPGAIDHVLVLTPADTVPDVLRECVRRGVGAVTLLPAGFVDGEDGEGPAGLFGAIVGNSGLRILGPNCLGIVNAHTGLIASPASAFMAGAVQPGPVSIVSQSGAVGAYLVGLLAEVGLGVRYFASTGNEVDIQLGETVLHYAEDDETQAIIIYLEGLRDAAAFIDALTEARRRGKNVIVIKAGETELGAEAVRSHTAALAGDDAAYEAAFERLGAYRARSLGEAVQAARASLAPMRTRRRVQRLAVMTTSGGLGILAAEALVTEGFDLPPVPAAAQERMRALLPFCTPSNPIDLGGTVPAERPQFLELLDLTVDSLGLDGLVFVVSNMPRSPTAWTGIRETLAEFARTHDVPLAVIGALTEQDAATFRGLGAVTASDPLEAARELAVLDRVTAQRASTGSVDHPRPRARSSAARPLPDLAAMELLEEYGVSFPASAVVALNSGELPRELAGISLPSAVKLLQDGVLHKAAAGNVVTGVRERGEREAAIAGFRAKADGQGHILVQAMVDHVLDEVIVSARRDETFGPMFVIGTGGRHVELLCDRVLLLEPVSAHDVAAALTRLRFLRDLGEWEDSCMRAVTDVVFALQRLLEQEPSIVEVEINPIIIRSEAPFAIAVDAVVLATVPDGA
jgi:acyl-CoA synthetase (NDP forming)